MVNQTLRCVGIGFVLCVWLGGSTTVRGQDDFTVRLGLTHGHLKQLFFGCSKGCTDGFDRQNDIFAPPPGVGTGFTVLLCPDKQFPPMYKDIRGHADRVVWQMQAKVHTGKPIVVRWDKDELPADYELSLAIDDRTLAMRTNDSVTVDKTTVLTFTATRQDGNQPARDGADDSKGGRAPAPQAAGEEARQR